MHYNSLNLSTVHLSVEVLVGGNVGVPMMMSNPSTYVTQQPHYVMQQPMMQPQYVMQNQSQQYVIQQNSMHGVPMHGVPMQSYGSQASLRSNNTLPRGDTQTSVLSTDTTKSTKSTKRDRPRTRQKRKSQKGS